jgi:hypothetical protein
MHLRILQDHSAPQANILNSLTQMVERAQEGDHLVWHYSGHGSQVPCLDGDEPDGLDEILCPYGMDFNDPSTYITDDQIKNILTQLHPGATIDVIFDSCHSGTATREGDAIRCLPYPIPLARSWHPLHLLKDLCQPNVALFSGCKSNQTSADAYIDSKYQGAFTYAFNKAMQVLPAMSDSPIISRKRLIDRINYILRADNYEQIPQLEASDEMKLRRIFA